MTLSPIHSSGNLAALRNLSTLAIDLGFASKARSCGLSTQQTSLTFADAIQTTAAWINGLDVRGGLLILEAPLSGAFSEEGNPMPRGEFETHHDQGPGNRRCWNEGPGAAMAFAALHFLRNVLDQTQGQNLTVHLLEGFVSRYGEQKPDHSDVAAWLKDAWKTGRFNSREINPIPPEGCQFISVTQLLGHGTDQAPPWILRLPDGLSRPLSNRPSGT